MTPVVHDVSPGTCPTGPVPLLEGLSAWAHQDGASTAFAFTDHAAGGTEHTLTWAELEASVDDLARRLRALAEPGERCAVLLPQGLDYVVTFLAAIRAGLVAVPLFGSDHPGHGGRVAAVLADCRPSVAVVSGSDAAADASDSVRTVVDLGADGRAGNGSAARWQGELPDAGPDDVAYLQYTSGSTREPAGVVVTHGNVLANTVQLATAFDLHRDTHRCVSWLPLFHDMGLVTALVLPVTHGLGSELIDPMAFVQRPVRWLRMLAGETGAPGAFSAAPNFAFDHCVRRVREADRAALDLSRVAAVVNGSEPVRPATIDAFAAAFGPAGFPAHAHRPSYGLAEATVFVSASRPGSAPTVVSFDGEELAAGQAVAVDPGTPWARALVSCGVPTDQSVVAVEPTTGRPLPAGHVGELWCRGANVARAYWAGGERSVATFEARLMTGDPHLPEGPWMRTGDLGVVHDGTLFVTGRLKDMIIVDGRNHYPQDIEATVTDTDDQVRPGFVAAFPVDTGSEEGVVVVAARTTSEGSSVADESATAVRRAVSAEHGVSLHDVRFVPAGSIPRTTSGKIARAACRTTYLAGGFSSGEDR